MAGVQRSQVRYGVIGVFALVLSSGAAVDGESAGTLRQPTYAQLLETPLDGGLATDSERPTSLVAPGPPPNIVIPATHRNLVQTIWERSPTFRRQCERIARDRTLTVRVHLFRQDRVGDASTHLVARSGAGLTADVYLGEAHRAVELLAHELEHIVERLEDIDVTQLARRVPDLVWRTGDGGYETKRAIQAGLTVASEATRPRN
jgi:hypothetical protein